MDFDALMLPKQVSALHVLLYKDDGTSVMGKSWRKDFNFWDILMPESAFLLFVFCSPYDAKVFFFFFLSCGKTALFLKSKSRASALKGENLPI